MNVFYLDESPEVAATLHLYPKHVVKMTLEYAQLLSTAHRLLREVPEESPLYKATHKNHPSAVWVRESASHYTWVYRCMVALGEHYTKKTGKTHLTLTKLGELLKEPPMEDTGWVDPPQCMPKEYQRDTAIKGYKAYYDYKRILLTTPPSDKRSVKTMGTPS